MNPSTKQQSQTHSPCSKPFPTAPIFHPGSYYPTSLRLRTWAAANQGLHCFPRPHSQAPPAQRVRTISSPLLATAARNDSRSQLVGRGIGSLALTPRCRSSTRRGRVHLRRRARFRSPGLGRRRLCTVCSSLAIWVYMTVAGGGWRCTQACMRPGR